MIKPQVITAKMLSDMIDNLEKIPKRKFIPIEEWINRKNDTLGDFLKMRVKKKTDHMEEIGDKEGCVIDD